MNSRRAWLVVSIGAIAYLFGVLQRTSLGVAGVEATERFEVTAAVLSSLAVVQIIVYAGLQIPVGVALDRVGPRFLIATGAILMAAGQITLAVAPSIGVAVVGRILVGAGDAMTFISVGRLIASWFSGRILPFLSQLLGTVGTVGQLLSALPFSFLLHLAGWQTAYLSVASLSIVVAVLVVTIVRNSPDVLMPTGPISLRHPPLRTLRDALRRPGTRLGFWAHFVSQSSATMFALLWGFPFLSIGLGYGPSGAATLLTVLIGAAMIAGPFLGIVTARYPHRRSNVVLSIVLAIAIAWSSLLAWPGQPPLWLVIALLVVIGVGGPGSLIGLDFARTFNPTRSLGSATGIVNVGGFLATFIMMFLIGFVLDFVDRQNGGHGVPTELYSLDSFRIAFLVQYLVIGTGVVFLLIERRRTRRAMHEEEGITVAPLWLSLVRMWRRKPNQSN